MDFLWREINSLVKVMFLILKNSRRITRGLFKSQQSTIINADVNGVYNILKKALLNAVEADRIEVVGLHPAGWSLAVVTS